MDKETQAISLMRMALEKKDSIYPEPDKKALAERCRRAWEKAKLHPGAK